MLGRLILGVSGTSAAGGLADIAMVSLREQIRAMKSETGKLPKGHSYPLRPSLLEAALERASIVIDTHLIRSPGDLFDAHFWPPNENVPHERLYVRAGSVPVAMAATERERIETVTIPSIVRWLSDILAQEHKSPIRREKQTLKF